MTTRQRATLGALLLLIAIPAAVLVAAFARGFPAEHQGAVPDWTPTVGAEAH